ncbi:DUF3558 family protein [Nocardia camponoti]|uniref:DUF3558 family protein n=1 Tax=Nocardia camponoti TaxID=1616106 RepID=UPI00166C702A
MSTVVCVAAISGCGNSPTSPAESATSGVSSTPVSIIAPPAPAADQSGQERQVKIDPCLVIGDDLLTAAGLDPTSRERASETVTSLLISIGCSFNRRQTADGGSKLVGQATVLSTNSTVASVAKDVDTYNIASVEPIAGRQAVTYAARMSPNLCTTSVAASDGTFDIRFIGSPTADRSVCEESRSIASTFARAFPQ